MGPGDTATYNDANKPISMVFHTAHRTNAEPTINDSLDSALFYKSKNSFAESKDKYLVELILVRESI